ncbi:FKBP-type peptidyl-prolyl cis-trans isomerases 2 [Gynuella sunshinyii YC6258]|uniref:Peptidyl-prolyl cis-trans isomerase n=2 Tax=Gynuella sunshinyii TaxID=1445505 RepID=A0A0C5VTS4_9GAMM|nr:FKBP-type peptidyl-prolyl cis-trans isomerases 2 [Gynuella sunshinyii YC6258]
MSSTEVHMKVEKNKVVSFHFKMTEVGRDEVLEDTRESEALLYLHGYGQLLIGLEKALEGREVGDQFSVELEPAEAFGEVQQADPVRVPRKHIATKGKLVPGMVVELNTRDGLRDVTVLKVGLKTVDLDANHPYAGKKMNFDVEVTDVRDATDEEIHHGHAHGPGGHHHH